MAGNLISINENDPVYSGNYMASKCLKEDDPESCLCIKFLHDIYNRQDYIKCQLGYLPILNIHYLWQIYSVLTSDIRKVIIFNGFYFGDTKESREIIMDLLRRDIDVVITESVLWGGCHEWNR